jgi:succinyl-CoA synthetase beta subunit
MPVMMASTEGGMEIEKVAATSPEKIIKVAIDPSIGFQGYHGRELAFGLGLSKEHMSAFVKFASALYALYMQNDGEMIEINPLIKTGDGKFLALDAKMGFDNNALYRQNAISEMRDLSEEEATEIEAGKYGLSYIKLDGTVGCMVNGAGLAMATMDLIKYAGFEPANFLDVGGTADAKRVETAFRIILKDPNVKAILINIFGGIVRCDRVAQGVVDAYKNMGDAIKVPIIVRLQGTNADVAKELIDNSGMPILSAVQFQEAADQVKAALS